MPRGPRSLERGFSPWAMLVTAWRGPLQAIDDPRSLGAGNEARTRDLNLGKVALYQLSYSRPIERRNCRAASPGVKKKPLRNAAKALNCPAIPAMPRAGTGPSTKA